VLLRLNQPHVFDIYSEHPPHAHYNPQVASFASTTLGKKRASKLLPASTKAEAELLLSETHAVSVVQNEFAVALDFGGIGSELAREALSRANRGGALSGPQLQAVASLVNGVGNLHRQINAVLRNVRQAEGETGRNGRILQPLADMLSR
jgi:dsDNA-specific endonuclease/ATPase MutS2